MMHIIVGPPCAGKSTYVEKNAKEQDLIVDYDKIAQALGSINSHSADGLIKKAAFYARKGAIDAAFEEKDAESWIIHTTPTAEQMESYQEAGAEIVELDPGYEECMARAERDGRPQQTIDGIEKWYAGEKGRTMKRLCKSFEMKAAGDGSGIVEGYASTWTKTPDVYGDIVVKGAFAETLEKRKATGHPFPLCFNHDLNQIIGAVKSIEEDETGLKVSASFLDTPLAQEKRELVKEGIVWQFSFMYDVLGAERPTAEEKAQGIDQKLTKLDLFEVSLVPCPANQTAVVTDIKSSDPQTKEEELEEKSGRRNSAKDEDLIRQAISALQALLDNAETTDEGEDDPKANEASEEPKESNPEKENLLTYIKSMEVKAND